eukprot:GHVU01131301.1.p1 GENE.GHVU01131301.1~~GHVU01131301.1.p1  ORF type:complete len:574 (+),score=126.25 GHVU01131301.1:547-2268(+)
MRTKRLESVQAKDFFDFVTNAAPDSRASMTLGGSGYQVLATFVVWVLIFLGISWGPKVLGRIAYVTVILPVVLIIVVLIRGVTLPGSDIGINKYIGVWDLSQLSNPSIWYDAAAQVCFSIGLCFGVMTAYAASNKNCQKVCTDSYIVVVADAAVSFLSGFAVFSVVGYLSYQSATPIAQLKTTSSDLIFLTFPTAFSHFPFGVKQFFSVIFYATFLLLGIDSAFSFIEALLKNLLDTRLIDRRRFKLLSVAAICVVGFLIGLPYNTNIGQYLLDVADHYLLTFGVVFAGLFQCVAAGWAYGLDRQMEAVGRIPVLLFNSSFAIAAVQVPIVALAAPSFVAASIVICCLGLVLIIGGLLLAVVVATKFATASPVPPLTTVCWALTMGDVEALRRDLNEVIFAPPSRKWGFVYPVAVFFSRLSIAWSVLIKYLVPAVFLLLLSAQLYQAKHGLHGDYSASIQAYGMSLPAIGILLIVIVAVVELVARRNRPSQELKEEENETRSVTEGRDTNTESEEQQEVVDSFPNDCSSSAAAAAAVVGVANAYTAEPPVDGGDQSTGVVQNGGSLRARVLSP